jgi:hypothetical protein
VCGDIDGVVHEAVELLAGVPASALVSEFFVLDPLVVVLAQLAGEHDDEVDVLLLEGVAVRPLAVFLAELVLQGTALLELEEVVLHVEDGDPVHEVERFGHDVCELFLRRHAARILCVYTGTVYNHAAPEACA